MTKNSVLEQLKMKRSENLLKMANWSENDFKEMLETYAQAKEIALESGEVESVQILEEKISQLNLAFEKSGNKSISPSL